MGQPRFLVILQFVNTADNAHQAGIVTSHVAVGSLILVTGAGDFVACCPAIANRRAAIECRITRTDGGGTMSTPSVIVAERPASAVLARFTDYLELTKPRIVLLELIVATAAACLAAPHALDTRVLLFALDGYGIGGGEREHRQPMVGTRE